MSTGKVSIYLRHQKQPLVIKTSNARIVGSYVPPDTGKEELGRCTYCKTYSHTAAHILNAQIQTCCFAVAENGRSMKRVTAKSGGARSIQLQFTILNPA